MMARNDKDLSPRYLVDFLCIFEPVFFPGSRKVKIPHMPARTERRKLFVFGDQNTSDFEQ